MIEDRDVVRGENLSRRGVWIVGILAAAKLAFHLLTNHEYGFHRDELVVIDDSRFLDWGYVAYPPFTPFLARVSAELVGISTTAVRFWGALAQSVIMVLTALTTRRFGGGAAAQLLSAVAIAIAPMSLIMTSLFQYISFDALWWVLVAYGIVLLLDSDNPRWWLLIGAAIGLGMMTKYTMAYWVVALVAGVFLTEARRFLRSPWLWAGALLSVVIWAPNIVWQVSHDFISFEFLAAIHQRDIEWGRTEGFLVQQLFVSTSAMTVPIWLAGIWFFLRHPRGRRFRMLLWMIVVTTILMVVSRARFYYLFPVFAVLFAGGSIVTVEWLRSLKRSTRRVAVIAISAAILFGAVSSAILMLPLAPIGSKVWNLSAAVHDNFREQVGWEELVETVAGVWATLPEAEREDTGIWAVNYGQAGAINLYGSRLGLPAPISGVNSYWYRGFGEGPSTLIVIGKSRESFERFFERCDVVAEISNRYGVDNEESREPNDVLLCRGPEFDWEESWSEMQSFG